MSLHGLHTCHFSSKTLLNLVASLVPGVCFSKLKKFWIKTWIQKFWNGKGVGKCDFVHLWLNPNRNLTLYPNLRTLPCIHRYAMTPQFSCSVAAAMAGEVVKVGYLMQGEIFIELNFVNTSDRFCVYIP